MSFHSFLNSINSLNLVFWVKCSKQLRRQPGQRFANIALQCTSLESRFFREASSRSCCFLRFFPRRIPTSRSSCWWSLELSLSSLIGCSFEELARDDCPRCRFCLVWHWSRRGASSSDSERISIDCMERLAHHTDAMTIGSNRATLKKRRQSNICCGTCHLRALTLDVLPGSVLTIYFAKIQSMHIIHLESNVLYLQFWFYFGILCPCGECHRWAKNLALTMCLKSETKVSRENNNTQYAHSGSSRFDML